MPITLPTHIPCASHDIALYTINGKAVAEILDTQTQTREMIHKALSPSDKDLLGVPQGNSTSFSKEDIAKLVLGRFYGPEIAAEFHQAMVDDLIDPLLAKDGGWLSSSDIYHWLKPKVEAAPEADGPSPR